MVASVRVSLAFLLRFLSPCTPASTKRESCASSQPGDFKYLACTTFCKADKAANYCKVHGHSQSIFPHRLCPLL